MIPQYEQELYYLTDNFYNDYPNNQYPELLTPHGNRAYNCFIVEYKEDYFICIPFRTQMRHRNGYHFRNSRRSQRANSGLDYSKMVIIDKSSRYLSSSPALVDRDEYIEVQQQSNRIVVEMMKYLEDYIQHNLGSSLLNRYEYRNRYSYSTLQYFHNILQIP